MKLTDRAKIIGLTAFAALAANVGLAFAADGPVDKGITLQPAASEVAHDIAWFHNAILMPVMVGISLLVLVLLVYVAIKFNEKANPKPATFTHNVPLEIAWTAVPVLILIFIAIFSFPLLYKEDVTPANYDVTVKVTGNQWYWSYEYPDEEGLSLTANMLTAEEAKAQNKPFQFATDTAVVVPVNKTVRVQVTASDVIHAWALPAFGVKIDAVPGTLNETWFKAERTGTFYGQCSEICGIRHAFMPIEIKVVTQAEYDAWIASHKTASVASPAQLAQAQ
jgi:cytochrome c oxidase subunit 2